MDDLTCTLAVVDDNKKHKIYFLMRNVVFDIVNGGRFKGLFEDCPQAL